MKIIALNGPPGSGKDTVAENLMARWNNGTHTMPAHFKISDGLKIWCLGIAGFSFTNSQHHLPKMRALFDNIKDTKGYFETAPDLTLRRMSIKMSEDFIKPMLGQDYLAKQMVKRINTFVDDYGDGMQGPYKLKIVISDIGFQSEAYELATNFGSDVQLIRLHRQGCDYSNDSRHYVTMRDAIDLNNDSSIADLIAAVERETTNTFEM